jgi:hypothetical protein
LSRSEPIWEAIGPMTPSCRFPPTEAKETPQVDIAFGRDLQLCNVMPCNAHSAV